MKLSLRPSCKRGPFFIFLFLCLSWLSKSAKAEEVLIVPTIEIEGQGQSNSLDRDELFKTEKVNQKKLQDSNRNSLFEVLQDQPGVDAQVYCANCGAKRLTINGLKAEHTSILVDGLPLHSAISSFYGVDNIPPSALRDIQVMRGTGASLTNPEAIGGTINLLTVDPLDFHNQFTLSAGINDDQELQQNNQNFTFGHTREDKKFGMIVSGQFARNENWDEDNNLVAELPERQNYGVMAKARLLHNEKHDFSLRAAHNKLTILGGPVNPAKPTRVTPLSAEGTDFVDSNVEKQFTGDPERITDWIETDRSEYAFSWLHLLNNWETIDFKTGFARNEQKAIYQHGFDYANIDNLYVADFNYQKATPSGQMFKLGLFYKDQRLRSTSVTLFDTGRVKSDSFDFLSIAPYASASFIWDKFELDLALRIESIDMNWLNLSNRIKEEVIAPRLQLRHDFNEHITQRFSYGYGYRAPLTFFESQHGNNESGYQVAISDLEKAHSLVYSLSYNTPNGYITGGVHYTYLENMAYGFEQFNTPTLYRNTDEDYQIWVSDLLLGYKPKQNWLLELALEHFQYEDGYTLKLPTAAIENRATFTSQYDLEKWSHNLQFVLVGSRDLSRYGRYTEHYVNRNQSYEQTNQAVAPGLEKKDQKAPTFFTINTSFDYRIKKHQTLSLKIDNLLDYTQTSEGDSPSTWHWHFNHAHYDGLHTWGPNAGRTISLSYQHKFH